MKKNAYEFRLLTTGSLFLLILIAVVQIFVHTTLDAKGLAGILQSVGVPLDDVYIHCRYADNLLAGNGYCFNPGATVTADTSPLWVVLLAAGGILTSHFELVAVILSALFHIVLLVGVYRLSNTLGLGAYWTMATSVLTFISARLVWGAMSGMEVSLACAIVVWAFWSYFSGKPKLTALLLALGVATRPELWLLVAVIAVDQLVRLIKKQARFADFGVGALIFSIVAAPVLLLPLLERGSFFFHSSVVQGARTSMVADFGYLWFAAKILFMTVIPPFVFALCGVYYFRKDARFRLLSIFAFGLPILLAIFAPQYRHHGRYFFPVIAPMIMLGVAFIGVMVGRRVGTNPEKKFWVKHHVPFRILYVLAVIVCIRWVGIYKDSVLNITEQHVVAAKWVATNTTASDVIACHDVGAIGYLTKRPLIDLVGLVTPATYPLQHDQKLVWQYARAQGANVFIIYNRLNPTFYAYAKDSLELQASLRVEPLASSADTVLSIYRVKDYAAH